MKTTSGGYWERIGVRHVLLVAGAVRACAVASSLIVTGSTIGFINPDTHSYIKPAAAMLARGTFSLGGRPDITRTPGYSLLLLPGVALGHVELFAVIAQILLSCVTVYLVYRIGRELTGDERAAVFAALVYALDPVSVLFTTKVVSETLFTAVLATLLYVLVRYLRKPTWRGIVLAALLIAAAVYVRPIAYYVPLVTTVFLIAWMIIVRRTGRTLLLQALMFLFVSMGIIGLWQVRNYVRVRYPGFSANVEFNLYFIEAAQVLAVERRVPFGDMQERLGIDEEIRRQTHPEEYEDSRRQRYAGMREAALQIIAQHPLTYARNRAHAVLRTVLNPGGFEYMVLYQVYPGRRALEPVVFDRGLIRSAIWFYRDRTTLFWTNICLSLILGLVYLLVVIGFLTKRIPPGAPTALLIGLAVYFFGLSLGASRFRHPIMPTFAVFAGCGAAWVRERYRAKKGFTIADVPSNEGGASVSATEQKSMGEAIGRIAAGMFIVTARHEDRSTGMLASWVQQVSFEPPLVAVAVKVGRPIQQLLDSGAPFAINVLGQGQTAYVAHFGKGFALDQAPFENVDIATGVTGAPILKEAVGYMECRQHGTMRAGDHTLYIGEVVAGAVNRWDEPAVRFRKSGFTY